MPVLSGLPGPSLRKVGAGTSGNSHVDGFRSHLSAAEDPVEDADFPTPLKPPLPSSRLVGEVGGRKRRVFSPRSYGSIASRRLQEVLQDQPTEAQHLQGGDPAAASASVKEASQEAAPPPPPVCHNGRLQRPDTCYLTHVYVKQEISHLAHRVDEISRYFLALETIMGTGTFGSVLEKSFRELEESIKKASEINDIDEVTGLLDAAVRLGLSPKRYEPLRQQQEWLLRGQERDRLRSRLQSCHDMTEKLEIQQLIDDSVRSGIPASEIAVARAQLKAVQQFQLDEEMLVKASAGDVGGVEMSIRKGADCNAHRAADGDTVWHIAVQAGDGHLGMLAERLNADANLRNWAGLTPLMAAAGSTQARLCEHLLTFSADVNARTAHTEQMVKYGERAEDTWETLGSFLGDDQRLVQSVCINGVIFDIGDKYKGGQADSGCPTFERVADRTALHLATLRASPAGAEAPILEMLIEHSADINVNDALARTPLWYAAHAGLPGAAATLLECGAAVIITASASALLAAARRHAAVSKAGNTEWCARLEEVVRLLLRHGASGDRQLQDAVAAFAGDMLFVCREVASFDEAVELSGGAPDQELQALSSKLQEQNANRLLIQRGQRLTSAEEAASFAAEALPHFQQLIIELAQKTEGRALLGRVPLARDVRHKARSMGILRGSDDSAVDWQQILGLVEGSLIYHDVSSVYVALQTIADQFGPHIRAIDDTLVEESETSLTASQSARQPPRAIALQIDVHGVICQLRLTVPRVIEVDKELFQEGGWLRSDLLEAISNGSLPEATEALARAEEKFNPTRIAEMLKVPLGPDGMPAVCAAVATEQADILELLLNVGASANSRTSDGKAALELACDQECWPCLSLLLMRGADPAPIQEKLANGASGSFAAQAARLSAQIQEQRRIDARTLARLVERFDGSELSLSSADRLLQASADANAMTDMKHSGEAVSLLSCASLHGSKPLVMLLIKYGARVRFTKGASSAIRLARGTAVEGIITRQSDEELQWAVSADDLTAIHSLLDAGINPEANAAGDASFEEGKTLVMYAIELDQRNSDAAVELMLKAVLNGAQLERKTGLGMTALLLALDTCASAGLVQKLLTLKADVEASDIQGRTPAMLAAGRASLSNLRLVLDFQAKADRRDACGRDATMHAFIAVQAENTRLLLDLGYTLDRTGCLAELFMAVRLGAADHVRKLLSIATRPYPLIARAAEDGSDNPIYVVDNTLLMEAVMLENQPTSEALLDFDARLHAQKAVKGGLWESAWTISERNPSLRKALRGAVPKELLSIARESHAYALRTLVSEEANGLVVCQEDLQAEDDRGYTALDYAVVKGCVEIEVWLCQRGATLRGARNHLLVLHEPVRCADCETITRRLSAGANVNALDARGHTPMDWAVLSGIFSGFMWNSLEESFAEIESDEEPFLTIPGQEDDQEDSSSDGSEAAEGWVEQLEVIARGTRKTPLSRRFRGKDIPADPRGTYAAIEEKLLAAGGHLGPSLRAARFSVLHPLMQNDFDTVKRRIYAGADCGIYTERGLGLVHVALRQNNRDIAKLMVEHKAHLNCRDEYGKTVLWRAIELQYTDLATACIDHGADMLLGIGEGNDGSVAHLAIETGLANLALRALKTPGAAHLADRVDQHGRTVLWRALELREAEVVRSCLQSKADVTVVDAQGRCLLHLALETNQVEMAKELIDAQAPTNLTDVRGVTPMLVAASMAEGEIVRSCLESGARPGPLGGRVALAAVESGLLDVVEDVILAGGPPDLAKLSLKLKGQRTALARKRLKEAKEGKEGRLTLTQAVGTRRHDIVIAFMAMMVQGTGLDAEQSERLAESATQWLFESEETMEARLQILDKLPDSILIDGPSAAGMNMRKLGAPSVIFEALSEGKLTVHMESGRDDNASAGPSSPAGAAQGLEELPDDASPRRVETTSSPEEGAD